MNELVPFFQSWIVYASSAAGILFLFLVIANWVKAYNERRTRIAVECIRDYLQERFGGVR